MIPLALFFFFRIRVQLRVSCLLDRCSTPWVTSLALFVLVIFKIGSCFMLRPALYCIPLFVFPHIVGQTCTTAPSHWLRWGSCEHFAQCSLNPQSLRSPPPEYLWLQVWAGALELLKIVWILGKFFYFYKRRHRNLNRDYFESMFCLV
jgi:hypothetical protein